jgi:pimeloyl-ACP methyl ester carboxylesterase
VVLVHAVDDDVVPIDLTTRYAARHRGPGVRLVPVGTGGHYGLIDPDHPAFAEVASAVDLLAS